MCYASVKIGTNYPRGKTRLQAEKRQPEVRESQVQLLIRHEYAHHKLTANNGKEV